MISNGFSFRQHPHVGPSRLRQVAVLIAVGFVAFVGTIAPAVLAATPVTVVIDTTLSPKEITVGPGTLVTWDNQDSERHRMRSTSAPVEFDSGNIDEGETFSFQFDALGTYQYSDGRDSSNSNYFGTIIVSDTGGGDPGTPPPPSGGSTVDIVDRSYRPPALTVASGTTVVWNNLDGSHTVTARDGSFDSGIFDDGTYSRTFDAAGSYSYFCTLHPEMVGTISVTGGDGSTPPPVDPPPPTTPPTTVVPPPPAPPGDVTIFDNGYTPATKTVTAGATVTWSNTGALPHTVTDRAGIFDSSFVMAGGTFQRTFDTPGTFSYFCTIHPEMAGTISVGGTDGRAPPPAEPPPEDPAPTAPPTAAPPGDVTIFDNGYTPLRKTISTGTTLVWSNTGALPHTVTDRNGSFDSGFVMAGQTYRRTFNTPGSYSYFCTIHPGMTGSITVNGAATGQPDTGETSDPVLGVSDTDLDSSDASIGNDGTDSSTEADGTTPTPSDARISADIIDLDYDPRDLTVERGTTVAWTNIGELPHTVTDVDGTFDSDLMMKGETYERRFETLGTFNYFCTLHPNMVGTVEVVEVAAATAEEAVATAAVPIDTGTTPQGPSGGSPEAMAIIGFLFVMAAGITGGLGMLAKRLLSSTPSPP